MRSLNKLKGPVWAFLAAIPCVHMFSGCSFEPHGILPKTTATFCDVEAERHCSTSNERMTGIDISRPFEDGFWIGKSSPVGLDFSAAALAACGGQPQTVVYRAAFPDGGPVCWQPETFPGTYATTDAACKAWCADRDWLNCNAVAAHSNGAASPFLNACTAAGTLRADFQDPRKVRMSVPVVWTAVVGATVTGSNLTKTESGVWGNAGAISTHQLTAGDGAVLITASETTTKRAFGLGNGNANASYTDIDFGLVLDVGANLLVCEAGTCGMAFVGQYAPGDTLEVSLSGGLVQYKKNGVALYTSALTPTYPLRVDTALFTTGATLNAARTTF
jgi:hypothetical protein